MEEIEAKMIIDQKKVSVICCIVLIKWLSALKIYFPEKLVNN